MTWQHDGSHPTAFADRPVGGIRYSTAADGSKLAQMLQPAIVAERGRRRVPTGQCHAVPSWSPARAVCGRLTERMALWPEVDFLDQQVEICPQCRAAVAADVAGPAVLRG